MSTIVKRYQIEVEMSVEVTADELVDLLLALGVQVLELVEIADHVQPEVNPGK